MPLLLGLALVLSGCAGVHEVTGTATQDDLLQMRADLAVAQQNAQRARTEVEALSAQLGRRTPESPASPNREVAALSTRVDSLTNAVTALTNRVEELQRRLDRLGAARPGAAVAPGTPPANGTQPAAPATALPAPGASLAPGVSAAPAPSAAPASPAPGTSAAPTPGARPATGALTPQDIYQAAYIDFSKGSYPLAIAGFREFVRRFPDHELADNAQYWIGEAELGLSRGYANQGQADKASEALEHAVQEFRKVVANYPRGDKTPAALYKEALALLELKQPALAKARLQYLVENFPQAEETPLARERLAALN